MIVERLLQVALLGSSWVMYLLLGLSVISISAIAERAWFFRASRRAREDLEERVLAALRSGDDGAIGRVLAQDASLEANVLSRLVPWIDAGPEAFEDALQAELMKQRTALERGMNFLGTLGNNAPFIGLFGTVIGVIEAFHQLGAGQSKEAMGNVMSGIAEALVATGVGLFVAIPAVVAYNIFQKRSEDVEAAVARVAKKITAWMRAKPAQVIDVSARVA
ncbi:MAG: MotA/TolQ/ExbB proton channel family protein [Myxococcota bacterium]